MISAPRGTARLTRPRRLGVYGVGLAVWLSGALWLLFHYFFKRHGPLGAAPHPLESWWLTLHGASAFAAIWAFGWLWSAHITKGWATGRKRPSGGLLVATLAWLTLSGYLLYYVGHEEVRAVTSLLHWSSGLACLIPFVTHRIRKHSPRQSRQSAQAAATARPPQVDAEDVSRVVGPL
jgi:hypothetical protein